MTGEQVADLRRKMKLGLPAFADLCGVAPSTVYRWESVTGELPPIAGATQRILTLLSGAGKTHRNEVARRQQTYGWRMAWARLFVGGGR